MSKGGPVEQKEETTGAEAPYFGRTCVRCSNDVDVDELAETRIGPMHRDCADKAEAEDVFGPVDHGDSLWPR